MSISDRIIHGLTARPECQLFNVVGDHSLQSRAWQTIRLNCGVRTNLRRRSSASSPPGEPSRFAEGDWAEILDRDAIEKTLSRGSKTRGLEFLRYQWDYCGRVYQVSKVMRRIVDDDGIFRTVSRTVLLDGPDCGGVSGTTGCGRHCPIMWRDEWLKPAAAPQARTGPMPGRYMRVRSADAILATLDADGKRDGLAFLPEMYQWAGKRFRLFKQVRSVFEYSHSTPAAIPVYILESLRCSGEVLGGNASCDRRCSILWHGDWLQDEA